MTHPHSQTDSPKSKVTQVETKLKGKHRAYLLVKIAPGREGDVLKKIRSFPQVISSDIVYGAADMIVHVAFNDFSELQKIVYAFVHSIEGVEDTDTCFVSTVNP